MYKLYTDKNDEFSCEVSVKNASLKNSIARLVVEADGLCLAFNGKIEGDRCIIPIKRLKGLLDENARGNMHLEVIVEDTYFTPWKSDFIVEEHTSVKVKVDNSRPISNKPMVEVKSVFKPKIQERKKVDIKVPLKEISSICEKFGIRKKNSRKRKSDLAQILKEYFKSNREYKNYQSSILNRLPRFMR
jgi:hypothetical protein